MKKYYFISYKTRRYAQESPVYWPKNEVIDMHPFDWLDDRIEHYRNQEQFVICWFTEISKNEYDLYISKSHKRYIKFIEDIKN